ncbi:hypothetical protein RN001_004069 [Aquatica leii]|uniref:Peptidase S1 domain-containing protein n=1 Tax=Aquatica leii TaxID=1421715 RepID=A0AAN7PJG7_9COLE|nr:hypothetical protein RN001_004069 [Aquatica leii]
MLFILTVLLIIQRISCESCNETECVSISSCPNLQTILANPPALIIEDLKQTFCESEDELKVCCKDSFDAPALQNTINQNFECGYQDSVYEFPWMASFIAFGWSLCNGALINERYVLTAATCASPSFHGDSLVKILLGDFILKNNNANCTDISQVNHDECTHFETYEIEKGIPHPLYSDSFNNIGLIRLNRNVKFNEFIRPICLPSSSHIYSQPGDVLKTSGFITHFDPVLNLNRFKKNVSTRFVPLEQCQNWLKSNMIKKPLSIYNTCSMDTSTDLQFENYFVDHGGPIMKLYNNQWYVESVLALAYEDLDPNRPIINTNISYYLDWIYNAMEPWN